MTDDAVAVDRVLDLAEAVCDQSASPNEFVELDSLVLADEASRRRYWDYCRMHVALEMEIRAHRTLQKVHERDNLDSTALNPWESEALLAAIPPTAPSGQPPLLAFLGSTVHGTIGFFSQEIPFSLLVAAVVTGLGLLIGSLIHVSRPDQMEQIAKKSLPPGSSVVEPAMEIVGRITDMVDCQWADPRTETFNGANVRLGRRYALNSGLMEITYGTGAKVILQGPCTYEAEWNGGYLAVGKLTGKLEKRNDEARMTNVEGKHEIRMTNAQRLQNSSFVIRPSSFVIHTPTATVTDLGTEFGVEVQRAGTSHVETFAGTVMVTPAVGGKPTGAARPLLAGEAVRIDATGSMATTSAASVPFLRSIRREDMTPYTKTVLADKPLAYWPLDEAPGARWIADHSSSRSDGQEVGTILRAQRGPFPNIRSRAIEFTGNGYVEINQSPNSEPTKGFSIEVWAKVDGGEEPQSVITDRDNDGGYMLYARPEMKTWEFSTRNGAATDMWDSIFRPLVPEQWTHIVGTFEPTGEKTGNALEGVKKLYINGHLAASEKQRFVPNQWNPLRIGAGATELSEAMYYFIGRLAEVAIYDHPLRADRVKAHYEASGLDSIVHQPSLQKEAASQPMHR